jgi:hypothetical protein
MDSSLHLIKSLVLLPYRELCALGLVMQWVRARDAHVSCAMLCRLYTG